MLLPLVESAEEQLLRESVRGIARGYGPSYFQEQVDAWLPAQELWEELGAHGFLGVHLPEEHGGVGSGCASSRTTS